MLPLPRRNAATARSVRAACRLRAAARSAAGLVAYRTASARSAWSAATAATTGARTAESTCCVRRRPATSWAVLTVAKAHRARRETTGTMRRQTTLAGRCAGAVATVPQAAR
ncbi:hypothetical protein SMD44_08192 [Streptomyces alboflavus]|uniref:Uncharacterized protein n=1 Tax=Streptomyces alboflavus TaxID=67267 RepID=A0A1Z1WQJ6_9ACTN|nr:hypothetical protein SMD44_08192 [Streptomyces alboflavus]